MVPLLEFPPEWDDRFPRRCPRTIDAPFLRRVAVAWLGEAVVGTFVRLGGDGSPIFAAQDDFSSRVVAIDLSNDVWTVTSSTDPAHRPPGHCTAVHTLSRQSADTGWPLFGQVLTQLLPGGTAVFPLVFRRHYRAGSDLNALQAAAPEDLVYERLFFVNNKFLLIRSEKTAAKTLYEFQVDHETAGTAEWTQADGRFEAAFDRLADRLRAGS